MILLGTMAANTLTAAEVTSPPLHAVGADSMEALMQCWGREFAAAYPGRSLQFEAALSADGASSMLAGQADIAPYARDFFPNETNAFLEARDAIPALIAVATGSYASRGKTHAIGIYVNASNPIESLSWSDLHRIFTATRSMTWGEFGLDGEWRDRPINTYGMLNLRDSGNPPGIVNFMRRKLNAGAPLSDRIHQFSGTEGTHALQQIVNAVSADASGIGYSGFGFATDGARSVPLRLDAKPVPGTPDTIRKFDYPLTRLIYLAVAPGLPEPRHAAALAFVDVAISEGGQDCVVNDPTGFNPLPPEVMATERQRISKLALKKGGIRSFARQHYLDEDGQVLIVGYNDMDEMLASMTNQFTTLYPSVGFNLRLEGTRAAPPALTDGISAFAPMGAEFDERSSRVFRAHVGHDPIAVRIAHASLSPKALSGPLAIFVNAENPIKSISMANLQALFGDSTNSANNLSWSDLGLTGAWGNRKPAPCGLRDGTALARFFRIYALQDQVLDVGMRGFKQSSDVVEYAATEKDALCFAAYIRRTPAVKALALYSDEKHSAVAISTESIVNGRYPLDRFLHIYLRESADPDHDPLVWEFMQLVLSPAGQGLIASGEKGYLPLGAEELMAVRRDVFGHSRLPR